MSSRTIRTPDGRELCLEIAGHGERTILVHNGTPLCRHLYGPWIEDATTRGARLISYDRPGYGGSTPQPGHTVADAAADVQAIAEDLGIERLFVWGLSGGGPYALACAALLPELVVATVVLGSVAPWDAPGLDYFAGMGEDNVADVKLYLEHPEEARRQAEQDRPGRLEVTGEQLLEAWKTLLSDVDADVLRHDFADYVARCIRDGLAPGVDGWWDDGVAHMEPWGFDLGAIRVPVKVFHGRHDRFVPMQHGKWLAEHVPGAEAELSEADGHLTLLTSRVSEVHKWLLKHDRGAGTS
jgi:pimeloyl-ACP methyl ester carboxylesterase